MGGGTEMEEPQVSNLGLSQGWGDNQLMVGSSARTARGLEPTKSQQSTDCQPLKQLRHFLSFNLLVQGKIGK